MYFCVTLLQEGYVRRKQNILQCKKIHKTSKTQGFYDLKKCKFKSSQVCLSATAINTLCLNTAVSDFFIKLFCYYVIKKRTKLKVLTSNTTFTAHELTATVRQCREEIRDWKQLSACRNKCPSQLLFSKICNFEVSSVGNSYCRGCCCHMYYVECEQC